MCVCVCVLPHSPYYCVLQYLLGGLSSIDVADWKKNTEILGYSPYDQVIIWFWKVRVNTLLHVVNPFYPCSAVYTGGGDL